MKYGRRRFRRTARGRRFRRSYARRTRRSRRRFYRRRTRSVSSVVCLTQEFNYQFKYPNTDKPFKAFSFSPPEMPGFKDYQTVYSHFRILKAKIVMATQYLGYDGIAQTNYLVVGSRPFAASMRPLKQYPVAEDHYVPLATEDELRQSKYQRMHYPNTTSQCISAAFYPYTLVGTMGPTQYQGETFIWQRIWEAKKWMPFTWAWEPPSSSEQSLRFFGPYVVRNYANSSSIGAPDQMNIQLKVWYQFKGQK
uniref:Capsid protein n=1 Tax=Sichuan rat gut-associated circular DNA virus 1 TaxID=2863986 RepID=A0A8K1HHA9_9VIRU|nr:capsid protein [Sichuan rat gut-associated circular DNA virus 1]